MDDVVSPLPKSATSSDSGAIKSCMKRQPSTQNRRISFSRDEEEEPEHHSTGMMRKSQEVSMRKIVDILYTKVLSDERLAPFFKDFDVKRIKSQQEHVMTMLFGGSELLKSEFPRFDLREMHYRPIMQLGLGIEHWALWVDHFQETLNELDTIPAETKVSAMNWMKSTKDAFAPMSPEEIDHYNSRKAARTGACPFSGH